MIKLIVGNKGSGKTKTMIAMANEAAASSNGNVVCVEKGIQLTYNLSHKVRLVDVEQYHVSGFDSYYGFLCGLMAGNYDITHIFCDAVLKIVGKDLAKLDEMLTELKKVLVTSQTELVLTISCDKEELPENLQEYVL